MPEKDSTSPPTSSDTKTLRPRVYETLATDSKFRVKGVTEDLFGFDQVNLNQEWDSSLPTLVNEISYHKVRVERATLQSYRNALLNDFPELGKINYENLLIAGGCVGHYMTNTQKYHGDIDIFLYGLKPEDADKRLCALVKDIIASCKAAKEDQWKSQNGMIPMNQGARKRPPHLQFGMQQPQQTVHNFEVKLIRNKNGLSLFVGCQLYQIIFRLYKTKSEILHGFDIGSSAVGFDGQDVYFTSLAKFSYEFMANIVDTSRRSTTYETRLEKYFDRGFSLILPFFDLTKLRTAYLSYGQWEMILLPHFACCYSEVEGNQISIRKFCRSLEQPRSDYDLDDINEFNLLSINMGFILTDPLHMYHYHVFTTSLKCGAVGDKIDDAKEASDEEEDDEDNDDDDDDSDGGCKRKAKGVARPDELDVKEVKNDSLTIDNFFERPPFISVKSVKYFYSALRKKVYHKKQLMVAQVEKYVTVDSLKTIVTRMLIDKEDADKVLDDVFSRQEKHVLALLQQHASGRVPVPWITDNPGTQLTSSVNPVIEEPAKWYGEYYLEKPEI
eukprot:GHVN01022355.1.p1 GENE.GHVN01022355.1~~GHVN01022355.1.p1  ORF type:complete len:557 (+),score=111.80 GHVN01022355.1:152-1822(+)